MAESPKQQQTPSPWASNRPKKCRYYASKVPTIRKRKLVAQSPSRKRPKDPKINWCQQGNHGEGIEEPPSIGKKVERHVGHPILLATE